MFRVPNDTLDRRTFLSCSAYRLTALLAAPRASLLRGADNNCAGGRTPWQTWLSFEEVDRGLDNATITAAGDMQVVLLTPAGIALPIFQRLYFSSQTGPLNLDSDGITYEISRAG